MLDKETDNKKDEGEDCPFCDNVGAYINTVGNVAICDWCWTYPNSVFYIKNKLNEKESA